MTEKEERIVRSMILSMNLDDHRGDTYETIQWGMELLGLEMPKSGLPSRIVDPDSAKELGAFYLSELDDDGELKPDDHPDRQEY